MDSDITLGPTVFAAGARLVPAPGATITLTSSPVAESDQHIFDLTAGGRFAVACPWISVKWFGALGDRLADDTAPIQAAANAAAQERGATVFFPSGST